MSDISQDNNNTIETSAMVYADHLVKIYKTAELEVLALQGLDLTVQPGELVAIIGNSGSGKSTFLNMLGGLDTPSAGRLYVDGKNLFTMNEEELVTYKRDTVGFVWQNNGRNLLPYLTAYENIMTPMHFTSEKAKKEKAAELLELVGLSHKKNSRPKELSGGEQQRVAIAVALANSPRLLLADEPTGSVDRRTADYILDVFNKLNREMGQTIIIVTHDVALSRQVGRVVSIKDGQIASERIMKQQYIGVDAKDLRDLADEQHELQEEYAILDRAGRVQIPQQFLQDLGLDGNKVKIEFEDGKIILHK